MSKHLRLAASVTWKALHGFFIILGILTTVFFLQAMFSDSSAAAPHSRIARAAQEARHPQLLPALTTEETFQTEVLQDIVHDVQQQLQENTSMTTSEVSTKKSHLQKLQARIHKLENAITTQEVQQ